jgi:hypothetical protein
MGGMCFYNKHGRLVAGSVVRGKSLQTSKTDNPAIVQRLAIIACVKRQDWITDIREAFDRVWGVAPGRQGAIGRGCVEGQIEKHLM